MTPSDTNPEYPAPAPELKIIRAKLGVPRLPVDVVSRPRLLKKLDAPGTRVVLVSAPAGSGKTVLIQDWLQRTGDPAAWLSLDPLDNEPSRFLAHFGAALALVEQPGMQEAAQTAQSLARAGGNAAPPLLSALSGAEDEAVVVLDDVHLLDAPNLLELLEVLFTDRRTGPRLVLLSRVDPPLSLGRLRLSGALAEIRQKDLRFTGEEAAELFHRALPHELSPELLERLETRTEGWAAGLRMAALALQQADDPREAAEAFAGSHELLADYLLEEALKGQKPEVQQFLLETSILPRFNEDACEAVLQDPEAHEHLRAVEEANLFLVSLDSRKKWYRYHHLFAELLQFRLEDTRPNRVEDLRERASRWFEAQGDIQEALAQAAAMEETGRLLELLDTHGYPILARSEFASFARWLKEVPAPLSQRWPMFLAAVTWFRTQTERSPELTELLEALEAAIEDPPAGYAADRVEAARHHLRALRAFGNRILDRFPEALEAGEDALASLPDDAVAFRGILEFNMGAIHLRLANMKEARDFLERAYENCLKGGGAYLVLASLGHLGSVISQTEGLNPARHHLEGALAFGEEKGLSGVPAYAIILYQLAQVHYLAHELEEARGYLLQGLELTRGDRETDIHANVLIHLARVSAAEGAFDEAEEYLTAASALALSRNVKPFATTLDVERARLEAARSGHLQASEDAPASAENSGHWTTWREAEVILQLQHCLGLGRNDEARELAGHLEKESVPRKRGVAHLVAEVALAALSTDAARRKEILSRALSLAAARGYVMPLVLGGDPTRALLEAALKYPLPRRAQEFVRDQILPLIPEGDAGAAPRPSAAEEWDLTDRESEVLALLAKGRTNAEMAKALFVSVNTVKTHLKNIFAKLDVGTRTEAVQMAERNGILAPDDT